ncbi:MAG TPA: hypothetical protein VGK92_12175 [Gaiellales bacterium]
MSVSAAEARRLALALPGALEQDHHGRASFRVGGAIFATLWDDRTVNAMLDEDGIRTAVHGLPAACSERFWGTRLSAVQIDLGAIEGPQLAALLRDAWEHRGRARPTGDD